MVPSVEHLEKAEQQGQKTDQWLPGAGGRGEGMTTKGEVDIFWGDRTEKRGNFTVCTLHLTREKK